MNDQILKLEVKIFNIIKGEQFDAEEIETLHQKIIELNSSELKLLLATIYSQWAEEICIYPEYSDDLDDEFESAFDKINQAIQLRPNFYEYYFSWGKMFQSFAEQKEGTVKEKYLLQAIEKFRIASDLNNDHAGSCFHWGYCLMVIGSMKNGENQIKLLQQSIELLEKSLYLNFTHVKTYNNLAMNYSILGDHYPDRLDYYHKKSIHYFSLSVKSRPFNNSAFDNWAVILKEKALLEKDEDKKELFFCEAISKHLEGIKYGVSPYNIACTYAVMGEEFNALFYLKKAIDEDENIIDDAIDDEDWNIYRELPKFIDMTNKKEDVF